MQACGAVYLTSVQGRMPGRFGRRVSAYRVGFGSGWWTGTGVRRRVCGVQAVAKRILGFFDRLARREGGRESAGECGVGKGRLVLMAKTYRTA